jgi:hypothetical protein
MVLASALLTKVLQEDSQADNFAPCQKCRRCYSETAVSELHKSLRKLHAAMMEIKALIMRIAEQRE